MHRFWRLCLALLAVYAAACDDDPTAPTPDPTSDLEGRPTVYYAGALDQTIWRLDPDATVPVSLRTEPGSSPVGIAVDPVSRTIFWNDQISESIRRCKLDGSEQVALAPVVESIRGLAVDVSAGKVYWSDYVADKIQRANLDGTGVEGVVTEGLDTPWTIAFEAERRMLYWMDTSAGKFQRWPVSGGPVEDVLSGLTGRERSMTFGPDS